MPTRRSSQEINKEVERLEAEARRKVKELARKRRMAEKALALETQEHYAALGRAVEALLHVSTPAALEAFCAKSGCLAFVEDLPAPQETDDIGTGGDEAEDLAGTTDRHGVH